VLAGALLTCTSVGVALATGNGVEVRGPAHARVHVAYAISFHGTVDEKVRWYLFVDYHRCGPNPAVEHTRANGIYGTFPKGDFHHRSPGWTSSQAGTDHACVYLTKRSAPFNGATGVIAHSFATYQINP
jgi:hypothetical protein